jgi:hypothetical protein
MAQSLSYGRRGTQGTPFPSNIYNYTFSASKTVTVPAATTSVIISTDADIWLSTTGAAAVPTGDVVDGTGSFFLAKGTVREFDVIAAQTFTMIPTTGTAHAALCWFT